jgi:hypothetical protein
MISVFKHGDVTVCTVNSLTVFVPIGATIPSGFVPSDPKSQKGRLVVTGVHYSPGSGNVTYTVEPVA